MRPGSLTWALFFCNTNAIFCSTPEPFSWIGVAGREGGMAIDQIEINTQHWRRREAEARLIALSIRNPDAKQVLLAIADGYKRLAEREARKAEKLIDGVSFGPDALRAVGAAFEAAWRDIADHFSPEPSAIEAARQKLAAAVLSIASDDSRNVEALKKAALIRMALDYRSPA
jgi:hypothetical protein